MESITVCPNCTAKNRVGTAPQGRVPTCGKCGEPLPWLSQSSDATFSTDLEASTPVLVDFWANWCGPCHMIAPILEQLAKEQRGKLKILKLNVDENPATASRYRVMSLPTLILFENGQPSETMIGALPKQALMNKLSPYLERHSGAS